MDAKTKTKHTPEEVIHVLRIAGFDEAEAKLYAAAPESLEALRDVNNIVRWNPQFTGDRLLRCGEFKVALALISRAAGN